MHNRIKQYLLTPGARMITWTLPAAVAEGVLVALVTGVRNLEGQRLPQETAQREATMRHLKEWYEATVDLACLTLVSHISARPGEGSPVIAELRRTGRLREYVEQALGIQLPEVEARRCPGTDTGTPPCKPPVTPPVAPAPEPEEENDGDSTRTS